MFVEHVNVTVTDPRKSAEILGRIFDWHVRWEGPSKMDGHTVHVGTDESYLALYTPGDPGPPHARTDVAGMNHIGVVVDDLDEIERRVVAEGYTPHTHMTYDPGRRFYFDDHDGIEFEVVSYRS
jgi:catechol 2,3-dioxygenase-like lactoylglutathione lyase family enzyme